jgi:hypothetical protein
VLDLGIKKSTLIIPITLVMIVLVSGCTYLPFDWFGKDVINVQNVVTREKTVDVGIVKETLTIPKSPLLPDQPVVLSFIIENKDDLKPLRNVIVDLYNAPLFKNAQGGLCNLYQQGIKMCLPENNECTQNNVQNNACEILAGEEKMIIYNLMSPTEKEIVNIRTQEKLDFKVNYNFDGSLLYTVPVVNMEEIVNRQRQGEKTTVQISKAHGSGPLQIDAELFGSPYILSGYSATFLFKIKNLGSGVLTGKNEIAERALTIEFPAELVNGYLITPGDYRYNVIGAARDFSNLIDLVPGPKDIESYEYPVTSDVVSQITGYGTTSRCLISGGTCVGLADSCLYGHMYRDDSCSAGLCCIPTTTQPESKKQFECTSIVKEGASIVQCTNMKPIQIYKDETRSSLRFEIPNVVKLASGTPFKSYEIRAHVDYVYELRNSVDVVINPYGNV